LCKLGCLCWSVHIEFRVGVFKFVRSSWGVQVGAFCEFLVSIFRRSKPPHHVKVNPLGEVGFGNRYPYVGASFFTGEKAQYSDWSRRFIAVCEKKTCVGAHDVS
jgi:hypothetical protein